MDIKKEIEAILERNKRVELDKAWEQSFLRKASISVLTYIFAVLWLIAIDNANPFLNGAVPVLGYFLSTLTLSAIRSKWFKV
jgi:hypothetical protein